MAAVRRDFPVLAQQVHGKPLCYLDNAASSQRPQCVIDAISHYYETTHANVHRGVHTLSQQATDLFEGAREKLRALHQCPLDAARVVFVRGTTEAINLVAQSYARPRLQPGDEIVISWLEHHANIVPWQMVCEQTGAVLRVIPITRSGEVDFEAFRVHAQASARACSRWPTSRTRSARSCPVRALHRARHAAAASRCCSTARRPRRTCAVDVQALDCDFYCFSGHKMCGPTGIGVLYGRESLLEAMPPWQGGGDMILAVSFERTVYNELPYKFEAGTPHIAGAIGLGAAVDYLEAPRPRAHRRRRARAARATRRTGWPRSRASRSSAPRRTRPPWCRSPSRGVHPHDLGTILDHEGVAIRTGHHCAMPVMDFFGVPATARASFAFYNTRAEVDRLVDALQLAREMLG